MTDTREDVHASYLGEGAAAAMSGAVRYLSNIPRRRAGRSKHAALFSLAHETWAQTRTSALQCLQGEIVSRVTSHLAHVTTLIGRSKGAKVKLFGALQVCELMCAGVR